MTAVKHVLKKDFSVVLDLTRLDGETEVDHRKMVADLIEAIHTVRLSFHAARVVMEIYQPVDGLIANAILRMCRLGIPSVQINMLFPGHPELAGDPDTHLVVYNYGIGHVVAQETELCRSDAFGEERIVHKVVAVFRHFEVNTREWVRGAKLPKLVIDNVLVAAGGRVN